MNEKFRPTDNYLLLRFALFILVLLASHHKTIVLGQLTSPSPSPTNVPLASPSPSPKPFRVGKLFFASNQGLMEKVMRTEPDFLLSTNTLQRHVRNVEQGVLSLLKANRAPPANNSLQPCNSDGRGYVRSMRTHLDIRGLPVPDTSCLTEFEGVHNPDGADALTETDVYDAIKMRAATMFRNRQKIADVVLGNWSETDVNIDYLYNTTNTQCIINHVGGLRIANNWYIFTTITNAPRRKSVPLFFRQWLNGYIHVDDDLSNSTQLRFRVPKRPEPPNTEHIVQNDTTESLFSSRGFGAPFAFNSLYIETIPALSASMDKADLSIQQASDALAPSSLAILLLPLSLNVIPLALLTDPLAVTTAMHLVYAIMTDIATVVPLGIKGIELIAIGRQRHRSIVLRMTSAVNGSLAESAAVEMWGAECRALSNVLPNGVAFLSVALIFMVIGIVLEMLARAWVVRKRRRHDTIRERMQTSFERDQSSETRPLFETEGNRYSEEGGEHEQNTQNRSDSNIPFSDENSSQSGNNLRDSEEIRGDEEQGGNG